MKPEVISLPPPTSTSPASFSRRHDISLATTLRLIASGKLKSVKIGRLRRITADDERAYLESNRDVATSKA